jgi:hypothetical protein
MVSDSWITMKSGVQLWENLRRWEDGFIGPNVTLTNDRVPRSKQYPATLPITTVNASVSNEGRGGKPARRHNWLSRHDWCGSVCCESGVGWLGDGRKAGVHRPLSRGAR